MTNQNVASKFFFFLFKGSKFCVCFRKKIYYQKHTYITQFAQRVNVQYKVFTLYEIKPGKKL